MKCKNCNEEIENPEINDGKVNCGNCGWIIGKVVWDIKAVNMTEKEVIEAYKHRALGKRPEVDTSE